MDRFFAADHLGSVESVTDAGSTTIARYAFDPWGRRALVAGANITNVGFTAHLAHGPSTNYLTLYRAYDPDLGRWLSEDPLGLVAGPNLYEYVSNDPLAARGSSRDFHANDPRRMLPTN